MGAILWAPTPQKTKNNQLTHFIDYINTQYEQSIASYEQLHAWSITHSEKFWHAIWQFCQIQAHTQPKTIFQSHANLYQSEWFRGAELNYAQNLLQGEDDHVAVHAVNENNQKQTISYANLRQRVGALAVKLRELGVNQNDIVAGCLPNNLTALVSMLATTSLGATWSSCSPDFGADSLLDRLKQLSPTIFIATSAHQYNGKTHSHLAKIQQIQQHIPLTHTLIDNALQPHSDWSCFQNTTTLQEIQPSDQPLQFTPVPFSHPLFILFSSGTTGQPKCIVHSVGGTLIQHVKEHRLHSNITANDTLFFFTTTGWMMWNWLVSGLATRGSIVLYDGSPTYPNIDHVFDLVDDLGITHLGVGAKLIETYEHKQLSPQQSHDLSSLNTLFSTGSPLTPASFDYVYQHIKSDVCLSSISGGTDIISCFALGNPSLPVYQGQLQCLGLGMDVQVFNEQGQAIEGTKGELVCTNAFPCMPIGFLHDPDKVRFKQAYFNKYDNVWAHGDYAMITPEHGVVIYGRSDTTLNPGGVRIGTAEIYRQLNQVPQVQDSIAVGRCEQGSEHIVLFVQLSEGVTLDDALIERIKTTIKHGASPHHVPKKIIAAPDLPRTLSGKLAEKAVKQLIHGEPIQNTSALANPECLEFFKSLSQD